MPLLAASRPVALISTDIDPWIEMPSYESSAAVEPDDTEIDRHDM